VRVRRREVRALVEAGDTGDPAAVLAAWRAWLADPSDRLWPALDRWGPPEDDQLREDLCTAATADPAGRVARFCVEHRLRPADPVRAAVYFLLIKRTNQYDAADPDGSLLTAAYAVADSDTRHRIRGTLVEVGRLDLLTNLTRHATRLDDPTEVCRHAGELRGRCDWDGLWRLTRDAPLTEAISLARRFPRSWRPADPAGGALLDSLIQVPARAVTASRPTAVPVGELVLRPGMRRVLFAPDGSSVAVVEENEPGQVSLYGLPGLELRWRQRVSTEITGVANTGTGVVVGERLEALQWGRLFLLSGDDVRHMVDGSKPGWVADACGLSDGFVILGRNDGRLLLGSAGGRRVRALRLSDFGLQRDDYAGTLGSDPVSGRFAVCSRGLVLADADGTPVAAADEPANAWVTLAGPDLVVTWSGGGHVRSWRADGDRLVAIADVRSPFLGTVKAWSGIGLLVTDRGGHGPDRWYRPEDLSPIDPPAGLPVRAQCSPDGRWAATDRRGAPGVVVVSRVDCPPWLEQLIARPAVDYRPADLNRVVALARHAAQPSVRSLLTPLRAALEHRFRADIEVGAATESAPAETDIALSDQDGVAG
jgi:hypothetical protein